MGHMGDPRIDDVVIHNDSSEKCQAVVMEMLCGSHAGTQRVEMTHQFPPCKTDINPQYKLIQTNWYCVDHRNRLIEEYHHITLKMIEEIENFNNGN